MPTGKELIEAMGLDYEEALKSEEARQERGNRENRICLCGHSISRHIEHSGRTSCSALRANCMCRKAEPVLEVTDVRVFMSKTEGSGILHALTKGILASSKRDHNMIWIEEARYCHPCGATDVRLTPMTVTLNGIPASEDTGYNAFFCDDCRLRG